MKKVFIRTTTVLTILMFFQLNPSKAEWNTNNSLKSGGLSPASKGLLITSGILAGGSLTYLIVRKARKKNGNATSYKKFLKQEVFSAHAIPSLNYSLRYDHNSFKLNAGSSFK